MNQPSDEQIEYWMRAFKGFESLDALSPELRKQFTEHWKQYGDWMLSDEAHQTLTRIRNKVDNEKEQK